MASVGQKREAPSELDGDADHVVRLQTMTRMLHIAFGLSLLLERLQHLISTGCLQEAITENGGSKRQKPTPGSDTVVYRLLCPGNRTGSIIGKVQLQEAELLDMRSVINIKVHAGGRDHQTTTLGNKHKNQS